MEKKGYYVFIIFLLIMSILGIYNFMNPIKDINKDKIVYKGKVLGIKEENEYDDNSEYIKKYYVEIEKKEDKDHISIEINDTELDKYKTNDNINFYENKGEYLFTTDEAERTNGGMIWLILSAIEICGIIFFIKKLKNN